MFINIGKRGFWSIIVLALVVTVPAIFWGQLQHSNAVTPVDNNQSSQGSQSSQSSPGSVNTSVNLPSGKGYVAHLLGFEEVPRIDTQALGQAILTPGADGTTLMCQLVVADIQNITAAHIHSGAIGQNGPVVATLYSPTPPAVNISGRFDGVLSDVSLIAASLEGPLAGQPINALIDVINRGEAYVNIHTVQAPGGEIRGQIYLQDANNVVITLTSLVLGTVTAINGNNVSIQTEGREITVIKDNNTTILSGDVGPSVTLAVGSPVQVFFDPATSLASIIELEKPGDIITPIATTQVVGTIVIFQGGSISVKDASGETHLVEILSGTALTFEDGIPASRTDLKPGVVIEATVKVGSRWATGIEIRR